MYGFIIGIFVGTVSYKLSLTSEAIKKLKKSFNSSTVTLFSLANEMLNTKNNPTDADFMVICSLSEVYLCYYLGDKMD